MRLGRADDAEAGAAGALASVVRYSRVAMLGRGGMSTVWLGRDHLLARDVALKQPDPDATIVARLTTEAQLTARLDHPSIVAVYDMAEVDGWPCFVMPVVQGVPFYRWLRHDAGDDGPPRPRPTLRDVVAVIHDAALALAYAHDNGVVHRDVSPANVFVAPDGTARVLDWGLASEPRSSLPTSGEAIGTPGFRAPENVVGGAIDPRLDVWSLGAVLDWALQQFPDHHDAVLADLVVRCHHPGVAARVVDARGFAGALQTWQRDLRRRATRPRRLAAGTALVLLVVGVVVAVHHALRVDGIAEQQVQAVRAEAVAQVAARSGWAAWRDGDIQLASREAAFSLLEHSHPDAVGLAMATHREVALVPSLQDFVPRCLFMALDGDGETLACVDDEGLRFGTTASVRWRASGSWREVRVTADAVHVLDQHRALTVFSRWDGSVVGHDERGGTFGHPQQPVRITFDRRLVSWFDTHERVVRDYSAPCPAQAIGAASTSDGALVSCSQGGVWHLAHVEDGGTTATLVLPDVIAEALAWHVAADGRSYPVAGTRRGEVVWTIGTSVMRTSIGEPVVQLVPVPRTSLLWVLGTRGAVRLVDLDAGVQRADGGRAPGAVLAASAHDAWAFNGHRLYRWTLQQPLPRNLVLVDHGLTEVGWSDDGSWAASLDSAGRIHLLQPDGDAPVVSLDWGTGMAKSIVAVPGTPQMRIVGRGTDGVLQLSVAPSPQMLAPWPLDGHHRRLGWLQEGHCPVAGGHVVPQRSECQDPHRPVPRDRRHALSVGRDRDARNPVLMKRKSREKSP